MNPLRATDHGDDTRCHPELVNIHDRLPSFSLSWALFIFNVGVEMATTGAQQPVPQTLALPGLSHDPVWLMKEMVLRNIPKTIQSLQGKCINAPLLCRLFIPPPPGKLLLLIKCKVDANSLDLE